MYESQKEQFASVVPFIRQGIERGERCLYVVDDNSRGEILDALRESGVDVDAALDSGLLSVHSADETYRAGGSFDAQAVLTLLKDAIASATSDFEGFRVTAEETWLLTDDDEEFMSVEACVNELLKGEECLALCQYNRSRMSPETIEDVIKTHPYLVYDGTVCENFYYTPPEEFFGPESLARKNDHKLQTLADRTEARVSLEARTDYLYKQIDVVADPEKTFEETISALLGLGREWFGLDIGYFAFCDRDDDSFEVVEAVGSHPQIQPGVDGPLSETYCRKVLESDGPVGVVDAQAEGWDDLAYDTYGLDAYLGTSLEVDGELYGTFCVGGESPRDEPFSDADYTFLELISQWISYELERSERERYLHELYEITAAQERTFEEKLERLLDLGRERFDLDGGLFLEREDGHFSVVQSRGIDVEGDRTLALPPDQYCNQTVEQDGPLSVENTAVAGWDDVAISDESDIESYLGTKVSDGTGVFGTVCFVNSSSRVTEFSEAEHTFLELLGQWVSKELKQKRYEQRLAGLNAMSRDLMEVETHEELTEAAVEHAAAAVDLPVMALVDYDETTGDLSPVAQTPRAERAIPVGVLCEPGSGQFWNAFVTGETSVVTDVASVDGMAEDLTAAAGIPLGNHGLVVTATDAPDGICPSELEFLETTAATMTAAYDRLDRERELQEREGELEAQNETLERLNRLNDIIRSIDQSLVQASTREEIETTVCENLAADGPYELAWIGESDPVTDAVVPQELAGTERGYLDEVTVTVDADHPTGRGPVGTAARTREPQVVNNILEDSSFEPWRQAALDRGYNACLGLPLVYGDTLYGVLAVYAHRPDVFDGLERAVLTEMSDTIAYAINAVESKKALVSDAVRELEFELDDADFALVELARDLDCEFSVESLVPQANGEIRAFTSVRGSTPQVLLERVSQLPVRDVNLIAEHEGQDDPVSLFEVTLAEGSLGATVLEHGGRLTELTVGPDSATAVVHLAVDANVREFVETFQTNFPDSVLLAQRSREQSATTSTGFVSTLVDALTARQLEALQTAYFSGYFEQPRERTASDIADTMDIAQPTFNSHLRTAHRKLCHQLFEAYAIPA